MSTLMTVAETARAFRDGTATPAEVLAATQARIAASTSDLNAYLALTPALAKAQAERAAQTLRDDPAGASPLCGVPVAIKDVICIEDVETTASSRILEGWKPPYTATAVSRLVEAGAVVVGKTNCDEFAMGASNENSAFGPVSNPWDLSTVPGGSSGGSAATVAAADVPCALGSDTGGSIRQPASLCGVVGFKPTYGRVSRYGLIAFASSLDQIGPFARTVEDAALIYRAIAGADPMDSTCSTREVEDPIGQLNRGVEGLRLGMPKEYFGEGLEPGVRKCVEDAIKVLEGLGATVTEISLPNTEAGLSTYYIIAPAECSSNLARMDGVRFGYREGHSSLTETYMQTRGRGFGPEVKRRIMLGTYALSSGYYDAYYKKAQQVRTLIAHEFTGAFESVDAIVCPTSPSVAFAKGSKSDPLSMYMCDVLTVPVNLAGLPGVSVPCGLVGGLPVGLQVIAPRMADAMALRVAHTYEQATDWHKNLSPVAQAAA
jgi:aspartyl-tRNA(Asn)/glutamyl-tRNA(Gln) amidotransferase subunit A